MPSRRLRNARRLSVRARSDARVVVDGARFRTDEARLANPRAF
jgi:hypothetical protein